MAKTVYETEISGSVYAKRFVSVTILMKAIEQYFPMVLFLKFIQGIKKNWKSITVPSLELFISSALDLEEQATEPVFAGAIQRSFSLHHPAHQVVKGSGARQC